MKQSIIQDEMVISEKRKITNEAFQLIMVFLIIAVLVKQYVLNATSSEYAIEFIAFFGACFYIIIRNIFIGNNLFSGNVKTMKSLIINSLILASTVTVTMSFLLIRENGYSNDIFGNLLISFIPAAVVLLIMNIGIMKLNQYRISKLEKKFDDEE